MRARAGYLIFSLLNHASLLPEPSSRPKSPAIQANADPLRTTKDLRLRGVAPRCRRPWLLPFSARGRHLRSSGLVLFLSCALAGVSRGVEPCCALTNQFSRRGLDA